MKLSAKQQARWAPWVLLLGVLILWQVLCSALNVSEFIFPSPLRIANQTWEFKEVILGHAWRTYTQGSGANDAANLQTLLGLKAPRLDVLGIGIDETRHLYAHQQAEREQGQAQITSQHAATLPWATHSPCCQRLH